MSVKTLAITHHENRGTPDCPYGFVYFNDGSRLGYADVAENKADKGLFATRPGVWDTAGSSEHFKMAYEYLHAIALLP